MRIRLIAGIVLGAGVLACSGEPVEAPQALVDGVPVAAFDNAPFQFLHNPAIRKGDTLLVFVRRGTVDGKPKSFIAPIPVDHLPGSMQRQFAIVAAGTAHDHPIILSDPQSH